VTDPQNHPESELKTLSAMRAQARRLREQFRSKGHRARLPPLIPLARGKTLPLSHAQERLWFLDQMGLVGAAYNMPISLHLQGELNVPALERSFTELLRRHESLRTHFTLVDGKPEQVIERPAPFALAVRDLSDLPATDRANEVQRLTDEDAQRPFVLSKSSLLRTSLLKLAADEHVLLLTVHHIIADGWSLGILNHELSALYASFVQGQPSPLEELSIQYADYALWQRQWLQGEPLERQLSFWRERLDGAPPHLQLPTDRPAPAVASFRGAYLKFNLPLDLRESIEKLARQEGATSFMLLLAAFQLLLSRYSGQQDIVVGSGIAGRTHAQIEGLIGFFVNTLVFRADLAGNPTLRQLLGRVKENALAAYAHQDLPFEKLVAELRPDRNLTRQPLFQVAMALQNHPLDPLSLPGLTWTRLEAAHSTALFDLTLHLFEAQNGYEGLFEYATDLFDRSTIERMVGHLRVVLDSIVAQPDRPILELEWFPASERERVLREFNTTKALISQERLTHELIEAHARQTPNALAVVCGNDRLTYSQLNDRANRVMRVLLEHGVRADDRIAICADRGLAMVCAWFGILKAGCAYVPLDVTYPPERLAFMLHDSAPVLVLAQRDLDGRLPRGGVARLLLEDILSEANPDSATGIRAPNVDPNDLAYVIYTSGSTGTPKGVLIEHASLLNLVDWHRTTFGLSARSRSSCVASMGFDAATWEIWPPLCSGGTLILAPPRVSGDVDALLEWWGKEKLDVSFLPTPLAELALDRGAAPRGLRTLLTGGDRLRSRPRVLPFTLVNNYGPTEITVVATSGQIRADDPVVQIGRPIANTKIYILDPRNRPVAIGAAGEIHIAGAGIARGYLNRADLTQERFLADPFASADATSMDTRPRMYRTGDLARWRPDGTIEFLGRNDEQVKIRGYRIELAEIEAQLLQHPQVKEAAALVWDVGDDKRLVAYVTTEATQLKAVEETESNSGGASITGQWQTLYEQTYATEDPAPSFVGWNSSYTGQPIALAQMRDWQQNTVARIRALGPRRVLEIGCGVGLLLEHLAPDCETYRAVDFSAEAIQRLRRWVSTQSHLCHVKLEQCAALDLQVDPSDRYDTIILNSVIQYFPDVGYLRGVLARAASWLAPGGRIFVGDVRHFGLLKPFHSSVQLERSAGDLTVAQLRRRIAHALQSEKELLIDPRFFVQLQQHLLGITRAQVLLKQGRFDNELTRYRYDVLLEQAASAHTFGEEWVWGVDVDPVPEFPTRRLEEAPHGGCVTGIPNRRLSHDLLVTRLIEIASDTMTVQQLRDTLHGSIPHGEDPEAFYKFTGHNGYRAEVSWKTGRPDGSFDVEWSATATGLDSQSAASIAPEPQLPSHDLEEPPVLANDPWANTLQHQLGPQLREYLQHRVPAYMVPGAFVILDRLPLTLNGKVDRRALPKPDFGSGSGRQHEAPEGAIEEALASIWQELLRVEQVGRQDSFFELGGHSLLIVQMMESIRKLGLTAEVRDVFQSPTLAALAGALRAEDTTERRSAGKGIPLGCTAITPQMLPLVTLTTAEIERITETVPGGASNVQDIYPLAPLQEGILFHHLLSEAGGDVYVVPMLLSLSSRQRLDDLIAALQRVIDRHDVLRTAVLWEQLSRPVQVVHRRASLPIEPLPLDPARDVLEQLRDRMRPQHQKLDLRTAPPLRLQITPFPGQARWLVMLQIHHIICDGQSIATLIDELVSILEHRTERLSAPGPYRDHVVQSLRWSRTHNPEDFFRGRLGDLEEPTAPFGLLDVRGDGSQNSVWRLPLKPALARRVREAARACNVSAATLFHAAWAVVAARTSGRDDVVFGTVLHGRMHGGVGAQTSLGMYINTLPLRLRLQGLTVAELIAQTQSELVELLGYEQASLAEAQRCSGISGGLPLFSSLLNYRHGAVDLAAEFRATQGIELLDSQSGTNYPITLSVDDSGEGFGLHVETDRRVDPQRVMAYMHVALAALVDALESSLDSLVASLSILPDDERRQVVEVFNETQSEYPADRLIHELFEAQVERTPCATAVIYEGISLTYVELNERANQLGNLLIQKGLSVGELVSVLMPRSLQLLIAQLAILKCGAVFVPIDPALPRQRRDFILSDLQARHALTDGLPLEERAPVDLQWIDCTESTDEIASQPTNNPAVKPDAVSPAYVMYTSGSTGVPKGVVVPHHAVSRLVLNTNYINIHPTDCLSHTSNPAFDAATFEVWGALLNGASVLIVPQSVVLDPEKLVAVLLREHVTIVLMTTGLLTQYVDALRDVYPKVRYLITGGDIVDPALIARIIQHGAPEHVLNAYGPTEGTTISTVFEISPSDLDKGALPIGKPVANTQIYILDTSGQPVPIGVTGEINVGGDGVALGYLGRPDLTAARFLTDPYSSAPNARLYKTGDLGRWRADGQVEFLGRNDQQVKIRGFRVEPGEIEAQLTKHPRIREAAVVARVEPSGTKRLVGYFIVADSAAGEADPTPDELREHLRRELPEYMLPSAFMALPSLPLTAGGKLDRKALPSPDPDTVGGAQSEEPVGDLEQAIAGIWRELLSRAHVGRDDDFFALGGHSLLAMQVVVRIRASHSVHLTMSALFDFPTVRQLSRHVEELRKTELLRRIDAGEANVEDLLAMVASLPESQIQDWMSKLQLEGQS
jgi:amino acid adenylation domain-containing protein